MSERDTEATKRPIAITLFAGTILFAACAAIFVFHFRSVSEALVPLSTLGGLCFGYAIASFTIRFAARIYWLVGLGWICLSFVVAFLVFNVLPDVWVFREGGREWDSMRTWAWFVCGTMLAASFIGLDQIISGRHGGRCTGGSYAPSHTDDGGGGGSGDAGS